MRERTLGLAMFVATGGFAADEVRFQGSVVNSNRAPVAAARVILERDGRVAAQASTDVLGGFSLGLAAAGDYHLTVEREGHFPIRRETVSVQPGDVPVTLTLEPLRELRESVDVVASPLALDPESTTSQQTVTGTEILNAPYPNTNDLRAAVRIMPGVVRDARGGLHVHGGSADQVMYTLNGFNLSDPLTGRFETRLSVESVQSLELTSGNLAAEYGKGSAGTLAIRTQSGDDKFRYSATNFVPGFEDRKGWTLTDWTPRINFSGPVRRGRAWFSNSFDTVFTKTILRDLPKGEDRYASWRFSNLVHTQVNITPSNILYTGFLATRWSAPFTGLSLLEPRETTIDRRSRQWFYYIKDQIYFRSRAVVEFGYAANRTFGREIPQGVGLLEFKPQGKGGFHFVDALRTAGRDQFVVNAFLPSFDRGGAHQVKIGFDLNNVTYRQDSRRTGYENLGLHGNVLRRTIFGGSGFVRRSNSEAAVYAQDGWRPRSSLRLEYGIRWDWDRVLGRGDFAPRLGFAWSPPWMESARLYGGFAGIFDATNLRVFTRAQDQYALTTYFSPDGRLLRGPALALFTEPDLALARPRFRNWTLGIEKHWTQSFAIRAEFLRRRGARGFSYNNVHDAEDPSPGWVRGYNAQSLDALYLLTNYRADAYDSVSLSVRHVIRRQYEWMASYTRSRALSNTVVDVNIDDPIVVSESAGRMPWDAPNRFLSWGYLPLPRKNWAVAYLVESRTGFPFNLFQEDGQVLGKVSAHRFPSFFEANLHLERRFNFRGHRWALRGGINNLTNRRNPEAIYNIETSPLFGTYFGGVGRSTNVRIRWLGRL